MRISGLIRNWERTISLGKLNVNLDTNLRTSKSSLNSSQSSPSESSSGPTNTTTTTAPASEGQDEASSKEKQEKRLYHAAREIMTSEKTFVGVLKLLNIDFKDFMEEKFKESKDAVNVSKEFKVLYKNLPQLLAFNEGLLHDFEDRIENWDTHPKISDVIKTKGPFLRMYATYMNDYTSMVEQYTRLGEHYPIFKRGVEEFESSEMCQNLRVTHFMLKPVQRLPQYRMLLDNYLKYLPEDSIDFDDTTDALRIVSEAADHANDAVKKAVSCCFCYLSSF